ncbi:MAG: hypothetical protein MI799_19960, partial [Desulfobacterales bacterium]|nr:hypothetical protein [Desulfobacterales bacterium]
MNYIALKQDYEELIALEHLLLDCQRRLILANEKKFINFKKNSNIHIVGTGFSAVLAFHALRSSSKILSVYDPFKKNDFYELPGTVNKSLEKFPTDSEGLVLLACAPGIAKELMVRVQNIAQGCELILLFADDDSENTIKYDMRSGWIRLNMSYRCINKAANMARCYRPVTIASPAPVYVMGSGLAGLIAQLGLGMAGIKFAGYVNQSKVTRETDLLVTYADETFSGKERSLCDGICCRSAQFLFRAGDSVIPGLAVDGFSECRLLGSGEEGDVFDAVGPDGSRYCYKRFYNARDRTEELNWVRSFADGPPCLAWMGDACGVPDERAERGICYPYIKLMHIPFMDEGRDRTLRATVSYCLQFQAAHISRARVPATMPGGIHVMCDESGKLRYVDIGNYPPALSECGPELLKGFVIKGLAGLTHETIFPGKLWKDLQSEKKLLTLAERLYSEQIKVPHWYRDMINEALSLPAESFK